MRILHVVADGRPGGGTTVIVKLTDRLALAGHDVHLVSQADSYALKIAENVTTHAADFWTSRFSPATPRRLAEICAMAEPDIIHVHGARAALPLTMARDIRHAGRFVYTVHGYHFLGKSLAARHLAARAELRISRMAAATVFVSEYDRRVAQNWGFVSDARRVELIRNGIDLSALPTPLPPDLRLVAFLGRLSRPKNPMMALDVIARLRPHGYRLLLVGGGEMEEAVRARIVADGLSDIVEFTGELPHAAALDRIRGAGALLMPSLWEGLPVAPLEAMGLGIPVVAARVGGVPEIVLDRATGIVVDGQNPESYAAAITAVTSDFALRGHLIETARQRLLPEFSCDRMTLRYLALYQELAEAAGHSKHPQADAVSDLALPPLPP